MANLCTLEEVKQSLLISHSADDAMLNVLIESASDVITSYLYPLLDEEELDSSKVKLATILLVSILYRDREGMSDVWDNGLPSSVRALLSSIYMPTAR